MPSATTEPITFQPGTWCGACAIPSGMIASVETARRRERDDVRRHRAQVLPGEQAAEPVTERHADDGERAENLAGRLRADEKRHADEADRDAGEPRSRHAHLAEEAERDHRVEDRHGRLDDRGETRVDARLAPREEPERERGVDERDDDEPARLPPQLPQRLTRADDERREHRQRDRGEPEPAHDQRRRRQLAHRDFDEHERRSPEQCEAEQHGQVPAVHTPL